MRSEKEMLDLIIKTANDDERIRAVLMQGSRANPDVPKDKYQDYDIKYVVGDVSPFYHNTEWVEEHFGKPLITQLPENIGILPTSEDGYYFWFMIFEDGNRIDLHVELQSDPHGEDGEPTIILLDKDNSISRKTNKKHRHIKPPSKKDFYDCCNVFWWELNNVAKGIARDELPYAMNIYNCNVINALNDMIKWFIGVNYIFSVSEGKMCKFFKRYLHEDLYEKYKAVYSDGSQERFWEAVSAACLLFHLAAEKVANYLNVPYKQDEEDGMIKYMNMIQNMKEGRENGRDRNCA